MVVAVSGGVLEVVSRCRGVVQDWVGSTRLYGVGRRVVPGLPEFQDVVAIIAGFRPGNIIVEEVVVDYHVRERDVPGICHVERVGDRLADRCGFRPGFFKMNSGSEIEGRGVRVVRPGWRLLVISLCPPMVHERVGGADRDQIGGVVDPDLGEVQHLVVVEVPTRLLRDRDVLEIIAHRHIPEWDIADVREREGEIDLLA